MTKTTPNSVGLRSSSRISTNQTDKTAKNVVSKSSKKQSSIKKMKKKVTTEMDKGPVVNIRDFKKQSGKTMYLVERNVPNRDDTWETEDMIESLEVLSAYHQKVLEETGYPINEEQSNVPKQAQQEEVNLRQRAPRASKTRAVIALKRTDFIDVDDVDENSTRGTKRKSIKESGDTKKSANKRKTKADRLLETQLEERLERKRSREQLDLDTIACSMDHLNDSDCCLQCGANTYRKALEKNDIRGLNLALKNKNIPDSTFEDKPNGLGFIEYAIVLQRPKFADTLEAFNKNNKEGSSSVQVPDKYIVYNGGNTGRNNRVGEYHRRAFRQVEESRGNRVGNSAFYREQNSSTPRKTYMNVEDQMKYSEIRPFMTYISTPVFQDEKVIENYVVHFKNGSSEVYFAVASGNRLLAKRLLEEANKMGRSTFNHLHEEVLKFVNGESLTSYKRNQILKMASDAFNVSPYLCSAINPSAKYLTEFFEALDPAERLETDTLGRSIAFYAAVSETSDCLKFIEANGINLSLVDKYKMSPLIQAARYGRSHNVELLIKHLRGGPEVTTTSPIVFQTLNRNRRTALHYAAYFGHAETCRVLINYGAPVEPIENLDKQTPLIYAAKNGYVDCVRVLVEEGKSNPEKGDKFSRTPLHYACINGHIEVVKYLLSFGVDANASDSSSNTPAHFAAAFGYIKILHLLIVYGSADPSVSNVWRSTPCSVANIKGHIAIVKYLLNLPNTSIDVNFKDQEGCVMLQNNITEPVDTPLDMKANIEKISLLLSMKADVNSVDLEGNTSLHTLVSNNTYTTLVPKGFSKIYSVDSSYYREDPVLYDRMEGIEYQLTLAKMLVEHGADLDTKNSENETPLAVAMLNKNNYLVAYLIEAGSKFWSDTTGVHGSNFFHYFGKFIAHIAHYQPHYETYSIVRDRQLEAAKRIWNTIEKVAPLHMTEIQEIINQVNTNGVPALIFSVQEAIRFQKKCLAREKKTILAAVMDTNADRYSSDNVYPGPKFDDVAKPINVNLGFNLSIWIEYMSKVVSTFKPDMDTCIQLPKDYKKNNPKAKRSEYPVSTGYTALHLAAETQCTELIQFLLENGSSPNVKVKLADEMLSGETPMIIAYHHKKDLHQEVPSQALEYADKVKKIFVVTKPNFKEMLNSSIETLVKFGGCPYITNYKGISAVSKAAGCADVTNISIMCSAKPSEGTSINNENEQGETALMAAISKLESDIKTKKDDINIKAIGFLLTAQADPNVQDEDGNTVLMRAVKTSYVPLLDILLRNSVIPINHDIQNKKHETALIFACKLNVPEVILCYIYHLKTVKGLFQINVFDTDMGTPLSYAAKNGNTEIVRELLSLGADVNFHKPQHIPLIDAVIGQNIEVVEMILKHGAKINVQDEAYGNSPLHAAVLVEKHRIVKLLLANGADFNFQNVRKQTPMHLAIEATKRQTNRSFRVEHLLLKAGADANIADFFGRTPLHYVFVQSELIPITRNTSVIAKKVKQISKELKIEQNRTASLRCYAETFDLNNIAGKSKEEENYLSDWMKAAKKVELDHTEREEHEKKSTENNEDEEVTILDEEKDLIKVYCSYGWETEAIIPFRFDPIDILKYLSDFEGLNYNLKDDFGRTPLHYAACVGAFSCTSLLINKEVDINALDSDNNGPVQLALRNNYVDYSVMLCNFGAVVNNDIVLKDGAKTSTFGFSLSQSLINMAYLIMDKGVTLIESIRDALKNGKFHMVEILLQSAKDEALSQTLPSDGQNMWHIISDFKPFDNEIWEEYIEDIVERLLVLNIPFTKDNSGRTPVHYAAKHGQTVLLCRFLAIPSIDLNIADKDGNSELYYAVDSLSYDSVKELLNVVGKQEKLKNIKEESLVLKSVKANNFSLAQLLLQYGFSTDEDSSFGRINSIMVACQNNNVKILKLLIEYNADLNKPSHVERKYKSGKKYTALLHPIFAASVSGPVILKTILDAGANPNVHGPNVKPENGRSCFMYNVVIDNIDNQKILLDFNVDLNVMDAKSSRTIFYQFFFELVMKKHSKKSKKNNSKVASLLVEDKLNFHYSVYEKMIQNYNPEVNSVDKITSMTPLELAIRERNTIIVERLIKHGAEVNAESCFNTSEFAISKVLNPNFKNLPAFIHAANENNLELFKILCSTAQTQAQNINWTWHDRDNRNIVSYIVGNNEGLSHENTDILKFVFNEMKIDTFKNLVKMRDTNGKTPVQYAFQRSNKSLYNTIIEFDPSSTISEDISETENDTNTTDMDVDYISTKKVDEDAQLERDILQRKKDLEKAKNNIKANNQEDDDIPKVDSYSNLEKVGSIMLDDNNEAYDIMLLKVEVQPWGMFTDTSFYKMSIIKNKVLNLYILWTRWGSHGSEGQHQKTPYLNIDEAVSEFKSIFKAKTGNAWEDRLTSFQHKQGRYELFKKAKHPRDTIIKNFDFLDSKLPLQLPLEVANLMKLICNYSYLSSVYSDSSVDMPLGQVPQRTIERAQEILKEVSEMSKKRVEAASNYSNKAKLQEVKMWDFKIAQRCVEYARLLPRTEGENKPIRSLFDNNGDNIKREHARMADLSYVGFAANVILAAKHHINEINPLEYAYHTLNCSFKTISFDQDPTEFQLVKNYMQSTSHGNQELVHLMSINRADEESRFRPFEKEENRQLLWHGSRIGNFMGILKQGLRISPRTSASNGAMLGNGVYFADTFEKSLNYATDYYGGHHSAYKLMLLCEVALGSKTANYEPSNHYYNNSNLHQDLHSMKGEGSNIPDPNNAIYDANGVLIPMGPCIRYSRPAGDSNNNSGFGGSNNASLLHQNEYAVYDENRVKIRYLLIIRDSSRCYLCSESNKTSLKPFHTHDIKKYDYSAFNNYEAEITKAYLTHKNETPQSVFNEGLEQFIESGLYKRKWNIPLDLSKDSKVCQECAYSVTTTLLEKKMTDKEADIPELLKTKPQCIYGKECRTQTKVSHAKKFQHWFNPNTSEGVATPKIAENQEDSHSNSNSDNDEDMDADDMDADEDDNSMDTDEE